MASPGKALIIVENLTVPIDRRVWKEALTLREAGYQVTVISPAVKGYDTPYEELEGIHVYRHPLPLEAGTTGARGYLHEYSMALWWEWRLARKVYRQHGFDIIHACNPPDLLFLVALWFKLLHRTRFIFDHHDLAPELYESKFNRRGLFFQMLLLCERLTFVFADKVISVNESYKEIAVGRGHKRPQDVHVVRNGPDLDLFRPVQPEPIYKHGRRFMVGYVGLMGEFDGVDHLLRAAHHLIKTQGREDIQFCLIGSGPMFKALNTLTDEMGIRPYVEFTGPGRISDTELVKRLCTCDVCVDPDPLNALNDKSTMTKIMEYMALARPIVQYDLREGRRSAGDASLYAAPNQVEDLAAKIAMVLEDPEAAQRMGAIGLQRVHDALAWKHQAPCLIEAYRDALSH